MVQTVIFDLDGTLADTSGDLIAAANACFRSMGEVDQLHPERDARAALRGGRAMLTLGFERLGRGGDTALVDSFYKPLLDHYETAIDTHTRFYPGALETAALLRAEGWKLAVCTNKPEYLAHLLLTRMGVLDAFDALVGADTLPVRKPDPEPLREAARRAGGDPARAVMVGDTLTDHATARAAGVPSILVNFGPGGEDVAALEPDAILGSYEELPAILRRVVG